MASVLMRYAFLGTLSIESDRFVVVPIEDPPSPVLSSRLHSSIELSAAIWFVSEVAGRMGLHKDAMRSHIHRKTDVLHCKSSCMFGIAKDLLRLSSSLC
jgi:hypothetical protein